jgi:hypothetical protein
MARTSFDGPLASGTKQAGISGGPNVGLAKLVQTGTLSFDATLTQNLTFYLPPNAVINDIKADVLTAYNSATSATLTVGTASAGTQYAGGVNAKTAGRAEPTFTAAQLLAMSNVGSNTTVVVTVTSVGQPTAGSVFVTLEYTQTGN